MWQLDGVFWPDVTAQQRRSHTPDIKNPIGACPRCIGALELEMYQSIKDACKCVPSLLSIGVIENTLLIRWVTVSLNQTLRNMARLKLVWNDDRPDHREFSHPLRYTTFSFHFNAIFEELSLRLLWKPPIFDHRRLDVEVGKVPSRPANGKTASHNPPVLSRASTNGKPSLT